MATEPLLLLQQQQQGHGCRWVLAVSAVLLFPGPLRRLWSRPREVFVELTLLDGTRKKGAVCLDGTPPGYHLQTGSRSGSHNWLIHLEGGGWCSTVKDCSNRRMSQLGSSNFMKPKSFAGGIFSSDPLQNLDFSNWNKFYVRYCDGAWFSGDAEGEDQDGNKIFYKGLRIYELVTDELMGKGLANATKALLTGCSAGGLATLLQGNPIAQVLA